MKKISVLFVCLGNICRSPAAEAIFISLLEKKGLKNAFIVDSAGTGSWHIGKKADSRMRIAAKRRDINILSRARQINIKDFEKYNYILAMDDSNFRDIQDLKNRTPSTKLASIKKIQDFRSVFNEHEVPDPYFGGDDGFDYVLDILEDSVSGFLESIS
ncbi:low molecular weight phosphotyrosine protein phosphatase [Prochlorococcus marinus XMU1406]|uniref:low molecular weight protein-tyrosine-phosphatase n=1 Tax=Prochlorococcus marinus TaxID=1219 RepID=UPI001ADB4331|nr:low molecular weight protein-tyrosine-phosphatase [Prochlorococcus marinus]MBO8207177.1 low molecular weight phosphotyrosine protein phosphatase [Prochlorococcus marinus XMU1406]MCR8542993.1 low molecular weight phosphotyrosine protein phosphatase [Prochlorococcus marinus XMU1427]